MGQNVAQKLIGSHLVTGEMEPGGEIGLKIDQTLTQDATGTLVMLELEAMGLQTVRTEVSAQYVDHNLLQTDERNPDDHLFLLSACRRFGIWYSQPGNGVSHAVHMQHLGIPGKTMVGSDSHTPAAGSLGMLAIGVGGLEVAMAMAGEPLYIRMPRIWGVRLTGQLPPWVSAKDVILELLRRHDVKGGVGRIIEYYGPGLGALSAMDRHVIANMGAELGATTTVFPSDGEVRRFLTQEQRGADWVEIVADDGATYDVDEEIDLSSLEPLIAKPSSPGNVVAVREVAGTQIYQSYIGSSANPGLRDIAVPAMLLEGRQVASGVSLDINPASRETLENLTKMGLLMPLLHSGARLHQSGCNGCIGMGQAPATGRPSLRTVPRNFRGRSGSNEDAVYLVSPETATLSALTGVITDPRDGAQELGLEWPQYEEPGDYVINRQMLLEPLAPDAAAKEELVKGPNISSLPEFDPLPDAFDAPVLLKVGDNVSTDEIMPAGQKVLPYRSNIPKIAEFTYYQVDETYVERAKQSGDQGHIIVGGDNYGQGSSREHAAIAPRYLGLRVVIAKSYARIHWQNLANFGILGLEFDNPDDYDRIERDDVFSLQGLRDALESEAGTLEVHNTTRDERYTLRHQLSPRQAEMIVTGGLIAVFRERLEAERSGREPP
ncbi:MAG: aconitate hydratase [Nitriliruptorales bacterium]|nr:aconitate hydratase [Nitriliruptorales bacterium]